MWIFIYLATETLIDLVTVGHCPESHWGIPLLIIKALYSLSKIWIILNPKTHPSQKISNKGLGTCRIIPVAQEKWRDLLGLFVTLKSLLPTPFYTTLEVLAESSTVLWITAPTCLFPSGSPLWSLLKYADELCPFARETTEGATVVAKPMNRIWPKEPSPWAQQLHPELSCHLFSFNNFQSQILCAKRKDRFT